MKEQIIFQARNNHSSDCGEPPVFDAPPKGKNVFRSYFENEDGEQWIFSHDKDSDEIEIRSGDCEWATRLTAKTLEASFHGATGDLVESIRDTAEFKSNADMFVLCHKDDNGGPVPMGESEALWFRACMKVVESRRS